MLLFQILSLGQYESFSNKHVLFILNYSLKYSLKNLVKILLCVSGNKD